MSNYAHKGQILPLVNQMIPIEKSTTFHASYDYGLHGFNQGKIVQPIGVERALLFDGSSGYLSIPNKEGDVLDIKNSFSIEAWVNSESFGEWSYIVSKNSGGGAADQQYALSIASNGTQFYGIVQGAAIVGGFNFVLNTWYHLKMTYDGSIARGYIDGVQVASSSAPKPTTYKGNLSIGRRSNSTDGVAGLYFFKGRIADVKIQNEQSLVAHWPLTEREGSISFDRSGNGNDGLWSGNLVSSYGAVVTSKVKGKFRDAVLVEPDTGNTIIGNSWGRDTTDVTISATTEIPGYVNSPVYKWSGSTKSGYGNCYLNGSGNLDFTASSTVYTFSVYVKRADGKPVTTIGGVYMYKTTHSAKTTIGTQSALPTGIEDCGNGWYRVWRTESIAEAAYVHLAGLSSLDKTTEWYLNGWQVEPRLGRPTSYVPIKSSRPIGKLWYPKELVNPSAFTISCWFNIPYMHSTAVNNSGINNSWHHPIIDLTSASTGGNLGYMIAAGPMHPSYNRRLMLRANGDSTSTLSIEDNTWYHLVATFDGTTHRIYIDGNQEIAVTKAMPVIAEDYVLMVGGGYIGKPNILIDELRIESRAISPEEAAAWAASGLHYNYLDYSMIAD